MRKNCKIAEEEPYFEFRRPQETPAEAPQRLSTCLFTRSMTTPSSSATEAMAAAVHELTIHQATVMSNISLGVAIPAFLASLPVCWVLRHHWKSFVCFSCCSNPFRPGRQPTQPTESDIVLSIILCLQCSDMIFALAFFLTPFNDFMFVCTLQGLLAQLAATCSFMFSMCLAYELWIVIRSILRGGNPTSNGRKRLMHYCLLCLSIPIFFVIANAFDNGFGRTSTKDPKELAWCWVKKQDVFSFFSVYGVGMLAFAGVFVCYGAVLYEVIVKIQEIKHAESQTTTKMVRSLWSTFAKVGIYPILMALVMLPGLIHRFGNIEGSTGDDDRIAKLGKICGKKTTFVKARQTLL